MYSTERKIPASERVCFTYLLLLIIETRAYLRLALSSRCMLLQRLLLTLKVALGASNSNRAIRHVHILAYYL
jgi:hypothetical protein